MKMFLRLGVFVFLGIVFLFVVGPADGQDSLYVGTAGGQTGYDIGDRVEVAFVVEPIDSVALYIEARGMNITSIVGATTTVNPIVPGTYSTDADSGLLVVTGTITPISGGTYISALWDRGAADDLLARADLPCWCPARWVFHKYIKALFQDPDVHAFFPDVLRAFKNPEIQGILNSVVINRFVSDPRYIWRFAPDADVSIIVLLTVDEHFRALFRDEDFHEVLQSSYEIDVLVSLIAESTPRQRTDVVCEIPSLVPSQATTLSIVSGYGQEDLPGTRLQSPFVVEVRDQYGKPFSGAKVVFGVTNNGGGSLSSTMATTNSFGQAQTTLTLGRSAGANWVEARVAGISPSQTFTATAIAPNEPRKVTTLSIVSGNNQSGESGMSLGQAFIVGVKDQSAKPLSGIRVTFRITAGRGQLSTQQVDTDSFGLARTTLTLGSSALSRLK